jgi:hypothetical protein
VADNRLSDEFEALSDRAKETAKKIRTAREHEKDQPKTDAVAARGRATATTTAEQVK